MEWGGVEPPCCATAAADLVSCSESMEVPRTMILGGLSPIDVNGDAAKLAAAVAVSLLNQDVNSAPYLGAAPGTLASIDAASEQVGCSITAGGQ